MVSQYELARLVAALPADTLKDLYWRSWKARVIFALDTAAATMQTSVNHLGLFVKVCHSSNKRGATIYLEYSRPGRKWESSNFPRIAMPSLWPPDLVLGSGSISWPSNEVSPASAYRFQQIILVGLPSGNRVPSRRIREVPHAHKTARVTATAVPLCSLPIFELLYVPWALVLPDINDPHALPYQTVKHPYEITYRFVAFEVKVVVFIAFLTRVDSLLGLTASKTKLIPFMSDEQVTPQIWAHLQRKVPSKRFL
jgi:hypothetical protein